jgi:two-component system, cell cycle response regulator DivK
VFSLDSQSCADAESDHRTTRCGAKDSSGVRRLQHKISYFAEFFGAILVSMAMNTSRYQEAAEATPTPERRYRAKRQRILVVDDDRLSLVVLRQLLTAEGYEILQSSEGWDGINRARNEQPDLIVMDINLPDISGLDATLLLKKDDQTKNIPIIAVTAFVTPADKANALRSGCNAYVAKPVNMNNLLKTVETFLSSSSA